MTSAAQSPKPLERRPAVPVTVRMLEPEEWPGAFPLMHILRPQLSQARFLAGLANQGAGGYRLAGAWSSEGALVGLIGFRETDSFSRGPHLYVDDLIVDPKAQHCGAGRALLDWTAELARSKGCGTLVLNARPSAILFYQALGFTMVSSPAMEWKLD